MVEEVSHVSIFLGLVLYMCTYYLPLLQWLLLANFGMVPSTRLFYYGTE